MSHHDDSDLWQTDVADAARKNDVLEQVPVKRALLEQRRLDLQAITNLLTRAASDLRASDRRAIDAEALARALEARVAEVEGQLAAAEARAAEAERRAQEAEERENKVNAQALRAFETMKERIAQSDARLAEAYAQARELEDRSNEAILQFDRRASEIEKAAEERSFELETRLEAAEMRIAAARRALVDDLGMSATNNEGEVAASQPDEPPTASSFVPATSDIVDLKMRH
jgi:chromosome segregation ATPase